MPKKSFGKALVRTVAGDQLGDAIFDLAEVAWDQNLADGVLKKIPIVGTLAKLVRAGHSISEELFIGKLERFLDNLKTVPIKDRARLLEQIPRLIGRTESSR